MPRGMYRSRKMRRVYKRTPGGNTKVYYVERKPSPARCANCKAVLHGVPRERPYKMQKMPKTLKRPERPFGGVLCSKCLRIAMIKKARSGK